MLKHRLIHPEILEALAASGHGAKVLIADGNYPASTRIGENAGIVYLNLAPGLPTVTQVLDVLLSAIAIEEAAVMTPDDGSDLGHFEEFRLRLKGIELALLSRYEFYEEAEAPDTCLVIVTGDDRPYTNLLLSIAAIG
jgi:L-fucose mutarotase